MLQADILTWAQTYTGPKFHALLCDPPYHLTSIVDRFGSDTAAPAQFGTDGAFARASKGFMGKTWDGGDIAFRPSTWAAIAEHLYPGAWGMVFASSRGWHRLAVAIEDAGLIIQPTIFGWSYGCLSDDTEILTTDGWVRYHKSIANSTAMCYNPDTDALEWHRVQELVSYDYNETAYHIHSDNTDQLVSRNHRCLVERGGRWSFEYAERLNPTERIPITTEAQIQAAQALPGRKEDRQSDHLSDMWLASLQAAGMAQKNTGRSDLRQCVSRDSARSQSPDPRASQAHQQQQRRRKESKKGQSRRVQPSMERRRDILQNTRQLYRREVYPLPSRISEHGPQRWLRNGASDLSGPGDRAMSVTRRSGTPQGSQPIQQSVGQLAVVCEQPRSQVIRASRIARPDLATVTPVHYQGMVWCIRVPTGAFVARRNGKIFITGNSGFPKATNIAAQIDDRAFRAWIDERPELRDQLERLRQYTRTAPKAERVAALRAYQNARKTIKAAAGFAPVAGSKKQTGAKFKLTQEIMDNGGFNASDRESFDVHGPATASAADWAGHRYGGQAIKPALEPIIVFQKPYDGSPLDNITSTGAGALWIDGGRIGTDEMIPRNNMPGQNGSFNASGGIGNGGMGRWPANLVLTHAPLCNGVCVEGCPVARLGAQSGELTSGSRTNGMPRNGVTDHLIGLSQSASNRDFDGSSGTASRYFYAADWMLDRLEAADPVAYIAKASTAEREAGLDPRQTALMRLLDEDAADFEDHGSMRISSSRDHTLRRCPEHDSPIPSGSNSYSCGCGIVRGAQFDPSTDQRVYSGKRYTVRRCPEHDSSIPSGSNAYSCGCQIVSGAQFDPSTVDDGRDVSIDNPYQRGETTRRNIHPTIKPISLSRYLATLLLPPAAYGPRRLLIPFAGAGSEAIGAMLAGWEEITGVELEADHVAIANARLAYWKQRAWELSDPDRKPTVVGASPVPAGQLDMFMED